MEYVFQFLIIAAVSFAGELLSILVPLPAPGSVYGLVLMLLLLCCGAVKLRQVEKTADFLVRIMPVLFMGPNVSLLSVIHSVSGSLLGIFVICVATTVVVLGVTGRTAQAVLRREAGRYE
ncbi:MAG: CidA/LrgA family protein [Oscillospiraceae bacterium]|nr:CidA/LrgA family protein [Oscillospiraceae bacterium]